jgi:hypothetical protein
VVLKYKYKKEVSEVMFKDGKSKSPTSLTGLWGPNTGKKKR